MGIQDQLKELEQKLVIGLTRSYRKMIQFKVQKGTPVVVSENGKILELDAQKIIP